MKRAISAIALASLAASASAFTLVATPTGDTGIAPVAFDVSIGGFAATGGFIGSLSTAGGVGEVKYTYLGKEAGASNSFTNAFGSNGVILDTAIVGTQSTQWNVSGLLNFFFATSETATTVHNGSAGNTEPTFAIFDGQGSGFQYIIAFSDSGAASDRDYDDMVFGVTAAIPEPETYALLLGGLGLVGFVARRRRPV